MAGKIIRDSVVLYEQMAHDILTEQVNRMQAKENRQREAIAG